MRSKTVSLTVQRWGNSLAVRIPAAIARRAHFTSGTSVEMKLQDFGVTITMVGEEKRTLEEKLALFDTNKHGGEVMASDRVGMEKF